MKQSELMPEGFSVSRVGPNLAFLALSGLLACSTAVARDPVPLNGDPSPELTTAEALDLARQLRYDVPGVEAVAVRAIELPTIRLDAQVIFLLHRVPRVEIVVVGRPDGGDRLVTLLEGDPIMEQLEDALSGRQLGGVLRKSPALFAEDFARIAVDQRPEYGLVLDSRESVPVDHELSDMLRDLRRDGLSAAEIRSKLLRPLDEIEIEPPHWELGELVFWTWGFYGGIVAEWRVRPYPDDRIRVHRRSYATHVGSWDYRM